MKYQFRPYAKMQPSIVTLTGKVYEKGEHPLYTEYKIIEVVDEENEIHYAFEDELTLDEVKQQERSYSEEDMIEFGFSTYCYISELMGVPFNLISENRLNAKDWFEQFKKK